MTNKRYLTQEECSNFKERLDNKGFDFVKISPKIFKKGTEKYRKQKLQLVLERKVRVTPEELTKLEMYVECWILSDTTFQQFQLELEKLYTIECIIRGPEIDDPTVGICEPSEDAR